MTFKRELELAMEKQVELRGGNAKNKVIDPSMILNLEIIFKAGRFGTMDQFAKHIFETVVDA